MAWVGSRAYLSQLTFLWGGFPPTGNWAWLAFEHQTEKGGFFMQVTDDEIVQVYLDAGYYLPKGHPSPRTIFKPGDKVLVDINKKSHDINNSMIGHCDGEWLTVGKNIDTSSYGPAVHYGFSYSMFKHDDYYIHWAHIKAYIPASKEMPLPSIPL